MVRILVPLLLCVLLFSYDINAQTKPSFFPEQVGETSDLYPKCCKPGTSNQSKGKGLAINYKWLGSSILENDDSTITPNPTYELRSVNELSFKLTIPLINRENFKLLIGYKYNQEQYQFVSINNLYAELFTQLDNDRLKSSTFSMTGIQSFGKSHYGILKLRGIYNGNYDKLIEFKERYSYYNIIGFWGRKKTDDLEWGIGLSVGKDLEQRMSVIPFVLYNRTFSILWGIEAILPANIYVRRNLSPKNILLFGAEYNSQDYSFDVNTNNPTASDYFILDRSDIQIVTKCQRQLTKWIWLNAKLGYVLNFSTDFISKSQEFSSFTLDPSNNALFEIGLFLSPPANFLK